MELECDLTLEQRALYDSTVELWTTLRLAIAEVCLGLCGATCELPYGHCYIRH